MLQELPRRPPVSLFNKLGEHLQDDGVSAWHCSDPPMLSCSKSIGTTTAVDWRVASTVRLSRFRSAGYGRDIGIDAEREDVVRARITAVDFTFVGDGATAANGAAPTASSKLA